MRLQTNTKTLEDLYLQSLETASQAIHDAVTPHQVLENQLLSVSLLICLGKRDCIERIPSGQKEWDNPPNNISKQEIEILKVHVKRLFGNEYVWVEMHRNIAWDKVENPNPQSTPQVPPSFEEYTPPVTYPKEVEKTLGTPIEVGPLSELKLEEVGLNCNHNTPHSFREVPSFDGPKPQPLLNSPSIDVSLRDVIGPEPPIKPHSPDSSRMKVVDYLTTQTPPSPHVANSHPKGVDISNWEMFDDDWGLES
ncbi:hypothetical protein Tco_1141106, partial [Tanacetum coccineum]